MNFLFFIFGLFWGSLLNNIAFRLAKQEEFLWNRSKCPHCYHPLGVKDLIPVLSYLFLRGKCRYCKKSISLRYPLTEVITGFWVFLLSLTFNPLNSYFSFITFLFYFFLFSGIFILALYDFETFLVDDRILLFLLISGLLYNLWLYFYPHFYPFDIFYFNYLFPLPEFAYNFFSAFLLSSIFLIFYLLTKGEGLGFGDVKTIFVIGLFFKPFEALLILVFSSFWGSIYGLLKVMKERKWKEPIPFVPFFFLGLISFLLWGKTFFNFYSQFFLP